MVLNPFPRQCKVLLPSSAFWSASTSLKLLWLLNNVTLQLLLQGDTVLKRIQLT
jgi:hypothetical protein